LNEIRSQLGVTSQLTKDQAIQIVDLERHLMQSNDLSKSSNQCQTILEQQLRDLRLTSEKYQISMQGQLNAYSKQITQREDQINALETANDLLKQELKSVKTDRECESSMPKQEQQIRDLRLTSEKQQLSMQGQLNAYLKQITQQDDQINALEVTNALLKQELNSLKTGHQCVSSMSNQERELKQQIDQLIEQHRLEKEFVGK
jgi:hypothetical protein